MTGISPDEVRGPAVVVHDVDVFAVGIGGEHSRAEASQALRPPAMQEDKSGAVGVEQQMIEIVFCVFRVAGDFVEAGNVGNGDN